MNWALTYALWSTVGGGLLLVVERRLRPEWREAVLWFALLAPMAVVASSLLPRGVAAPDASMPFSPRLSITLPVAATRAMPDRLPIGATLLGIWGIGVAVLLTRDVVRRKRLMRSLNRQPAAHPALHDLAKRLGLHRPVTLTRSASVPVPLAIGGGEVCVPDSLLAQPDSVDLVPILAHELAHLVRHDPRAQQLVRLISIVLWWQPLTRVIGRQLAAVAELRTDALASTIVPPTQLASALLQFAEAKPPPNAPGLPAFPSGLLHERVLALIEERPEAGSLRVRVGLCVLASVLACQFTPQVALAELRQAVVIPAMIANRVSAQLPTLPPASPGFTTQARARSTTPQHEPVIAPGDGDVVAALKSLLLDPEQHVRVAARTSLRRLALDASRQALQDDPMAAVDAAKDIP